MGDKVTLTPAVTQINIKQHASALNQGPTMLCYINNPFQGGLSHYKHMGIQLAADVYIPKDSLKINICKGTDGQDIIESVNLPTLNGIYYPSSSGTVINLSKIFKKIDLGEEEIRSISISATKYFYGHMEKIIVSDSEKPAINLFLGNIILYRAETIPFYHDRMRFKLYNTNKGEITHYSDGIDDDTIQIRKLGSVLDYD